jgi:hypothetical protein
MHQPVVPNIASTCRTGMIVIAKTRLRMAAYCSTVMLAARMTSPQSFASALTNSPISFVSRVLA